MSIRSVFFKTQMRRSIGLIVLLLTALVAVTQWIFPHYPRWHGFDLQHYHEISLFIRQGLVPYRDFMLEYPPGSSIPIFLPQLFSLNAPLDSIDYAVGFVAQNILFTAFVAWGLAAVATRRNTTLLKYALLVVAISPLLPWRYDMFPTLLTSIGLWGAVSGFPVISGIALGSGIAAKLYPVVLVPIFFLYYIASRRLQDAVTLAIASISTTIFIFIPFWWLAPDNFFSFLIYHKDRGLQIESVYAGIVSLGDVLGLTEASSEMSYGAQHLISTLSEPLLKLQPFLFVSVMVLVYSLAWLRFRQMSRFGEITPETLATYCVAALLGFILTSKVFSPQYLIWLLPFLPLLCWRVVAVAAISFGLTTTVSFVTQKLRLMYPPSVILLNFRNFLLFVIFVKLLIYKFHDRKL